MTALPVPTSRRAAFGVALLGACSDAHTRAVGLGRAAVALRWQVQLALLLALAGSHSAVASNLAYAASSGGCKSESADTMLKFVEYTAEFLIAVGSGVSILMFSIGACFIIFGGNQRRVSKGMEIIRQTAIGLAILASGVFLRTIVVSFVFNGNTRARNSC